MAALLIGYARCSTDQQDLTAQHDGLTALGVSPARIYVDHGLTGTTRDRPGLREAMAACREGDTLVVTKLDRLARSLPDARAIADELTARQVRLSLGASVYDPNDPVGRLLFNVLAMVAEFESDLVRLRTRPPLSMSEVLHGQADGAVVLDTCEPADFAAGHLRGSVNVGLGGRFAEWAGDVLRPDQDIVLVCEPGRELEAKVRLGRIGFDNVRGHLAKPLQTFLDNPNSFNAARG